MRRRYLLLAAIAIVAIAVVPAMAFGNAGVHGNYIMDDDACAGCHRAHTAPSQITWTDSTGADQSALLLSTATTMEEFCLLCHDSSGQGAETNVEDGIYNSELGGLYGTDGAELNGGLIGRQVEISPGVFERQDAVGNPVTSVHLAPGAPPTGGWIAYGGGAWGSTQAVDASGSTVADADNWGGPRTELDCATCHDVHGTSNYRILKDMVRGVKVGGYVPSADPENPDPTPFVVSGEPGFPAEGFRLHTDYQALGYVPNYTTAMYSKPPNEDVYKGMVGWCTGCHTVYAHDTTSTVYSAADTPFGEWDTIMRYRHPMNVPLSNWKGPNSIIVTTSVMPFANSLADVATKDATDWLECLTCHKAHGVTSVMSGYANVGDASNPIPDSGTDPGGVRPDRGSALLRLPNRGVCERCHNK